ncbi:MAG TPA: Rid family hydrolase [Acidimicrobiales bacterium]|nr:Rid family hydrolase [Acidimicrobiales bacterium]
MKILAERGLAITPEPLATFYEETGVPGAVRRDDRIWVTGQTGLLADGSVPSTITDQIRQAFTLVGECLEAADSSWSEVVEMTTYVVGLREHGEAMIEIAGEFLSVPFPAWTAVGVSELWEEGAMFEVQVTAAAK